MCSIVHNIILICISSVELAHAHPILYQFYVVVGSSTLLISICVIFMKNVILDARNIL